MKKILTITLLLLVTGCSSTSSKIIGGVIGSSIYGARSPGTEIEQIYYLGSFDPQGQLKPEMYRIRVHGQASAISGVKFGSGWAPAQLVDSLSTSYQFADANKHATHTGSELASSIGVGRAQMLFGPEGFREAPRNHRLVLVMGGSPEAFFQAIDKTLGSVAQVQANQRYSGLDRELFTALSTLISERRGIDRITKVIAGDKSRLEKDKPSEVEPEPKQVDSETIINNSDVIINEAAN